MGELVVAYFDVQTRHLLLGTEENHGSTQDTWSLADVYAWHPTSMKQVLPTQPNQNCAQSFLLPCRLEP
jgi:hypothetical protein